MAKIRKTLLTAVAMKIVQEARKPENQRRIREFVDTQRARARSRRTT